MRFDEIAKSISMTDETIKKIERLEQLCAQGEKKKSKNEIVILVEEILEDLFKTNYGFMIPYEFLDTDLGAFLFQAKYTNAYNYSTYELEIILHRDKPNLYFHRKQGNLKFINRGGRYEVTEKELRRFMKEYEGLSTKEINNRLGAFWDLKKLDDNKTKNKDVMRSLYAQALERY